MSTIHVEASHEVSPAELAVLQDLSKAIEVVHQDRQSDDAVSLDEMGGTVISMLIECDIKRQAPDVYACMLAAAALLMLEGGAVTIEPITASDNLH
ncbi:MAG: hypothetical protein HYZ18_13920 [Pseudogulbenkiania sp.]|nr:hypothetical protein [Pseudogulbenkiania sp.]